ncbi:hypothetical protein AGMMS49921_13780 [Endomicrobiia bacterium]|nr:hypothetical protein AGMMS49921_13780 [Endomicrobiia bacterium]
MEEARGEYKKANDEYNDECNKKKDDIEKKLKAAKVSEFLNSLSKRNDKNKSAGKNDKANIVDTTADDELAVEAKLEEKKRKRDECKARVDELEILKESSIGAKKELEKKQEELSKGKIGLGKSKAKVAKAEQNKQENIEKF